MLITTCVILGCLFLLQLINFCVYNHYIYKSQQFLASICEDPNFFEPSFKKGISAYSLPKYMLKKNRRLGIKLCLYIGIAYFLQFLAVITIFIWIITSATQQ